MARTHVDLKTVRNPVTRVRAEEIKAKLDDHDDALDAIDALDDGGLVGEYLGAPDLADDNYFLISTVMKATAYTLDETALPADNPPRNVSITHTIDTTVDTLGNAVVVGTDYEDNPITETIAIVSSTTVYGAKAFKTIVSVTTPGWIIAGGVADTIEVGYGPKLGLSRKLTSATQVFMATLNGVAVLPIITVSPTLIENNTIDISSATYDGTKLARAMLNFDTMGMVGEYLGTPTLADDNYYVVSTNMKATAYTLAQTAVPAGDPPRNVTVTHTQVGGVTDTLGDAVVVGTDVEDNPITENITLVENSAVAGTKAFKTITSITTADWVIDTTEDTIIFGFGTCLGLNRRLSNANQVFMATLAGVGVLPVVAVNASLVEENTIDISSATYNGTKVARAVINFEAA